MATLVLAVDEHFDLDVVRVHADDTPRAVLPWYADVVPEFKLRPRSIVSCHEAILPLIGAKTFEPITRTRVSAKLRDPSCLPLARR